MIEEPTVTVLGLGNILLADEGVGVHVVRAFEARYSVPRHVEVVDGGAAGLDLIPFIEGREKVLMVDAVNFGRKPGFIGVLRNGDIPAGITEKASLHHLGLMDVLSIIRMSGGLPGELRLIGIQPKSLELGLDMTPKIRKKRTALVDHVVSTLLEWNIPCALRSHRG